MEKDVHAAWKRVQDENPDIFWTPHYGGTWVATRAEDIERMQTDHVLFSMTAQAIPRNLSPNLPMELDPPNHAPIRRILNPLFTPTVIKRLETVARATAIELIEGFKPNGKCEFISQFGRQLPITLFLTLVDLPNVDRGMLLDLAEIRVRGNDPVKREGAKRQLLAHLDGIIQKRLAEPGDDVVSKIVNADVGGEKIPLETAQNLLSVVMFGGLDTVATMMGFVARRFAMDVRLREELILHPERISSAVDEFVRLHGLTTGGRLIMRDVDYKGAPLREGDQIMVPTVVAGLDERRFPDPTVVDIDRANKLQTLTFGNGPHRCPGAALGKAELRIFIEEWLRRIPEFSLDPAEPPVMASGLVSGILRMNLVWPL